MTTAPALDVRRGRIAVVIAFALAGVTFASWASRLPETRDALGITPGELGLLLLALAVGSVTTLPLAGSVAEKVGTARAVLGAGVLNVAGLAWAGVAAHVLHSVPLTALGLLAFGAGAGLWDVAMNLEGAVVERLIRRSIMPAFHAAFSLGTVGGAGLGALMALLSVPPAIHLGAVAALGGVALAWGVRWFLPEGAGGEEHSDVQPTSARRAMRAAWTDRRTLLIGVLVLAMAFSEGTANDWLAVALVDGYGVSPALGAVGFAAFVSTMTLSRLAGTRALDRWGRVPVLRVTMLMAMVGVIVVVVAGSYPLALVGALVWGAGAALGFPVGISAAADDPRHAPQRVGVVTTIGYTAFLAGPPLLGFLGDRFGTLDSLLTVAVITVPALLVTRFAAPVAPVPATDRT